METAVIIAISSFFLAAVLYMLMIMPRLIGRPNVKPFYHWMYAHRGLHDNQTEAPENSLPAFQKAVDAGFGIEMDIQLSKDGIPVVFHDFDLKRVCGVPGKVKDYTYEELKQFTLFDSRQRIPTLEEVLDLVNGRVPLIVELKIEFCNLSVCTRGDRLLSKYKGLYCIESFNPLGVFWYRCHRGRVVRGQLSEAFHREGEYKGILFFLHQNLVFNFLTKPDFIAYNHKHKNMLSRKLCRSLYHNTAAAWTIKNQEQLNEAKKNFDIYIFDSFIPDRGQNRVTPQM